MKKNLKFIFFSLCCISYSSHAAIWQPVEADTTPDSSSQPSDLVYQTDLVKLRQVLSNITADNKSNSKRSASQSSQTVIQLPVANGQIQRFSVEEAAIMAPELAARYPQIKNYRVTGLDDANTSGRIGMDPDSFYASLYSPASGHFSIGEDSTNAQNYVVRKERMQLEPGTSCDVENIPVSEPGSQPQHSSVLPDNRQHAFSGRPQGHLIRYRLAIATTYEYSRIVGDGTPSKAASMAAVVSVMNKVTSIYEREAGITFELINETDDFFFLNADDPYSGDQYTQIKQNVVVMDPKKNQFDIGHLFSTGSGGLASVRVACGPYKARGGSFGNKNSKVYLTQLSFPKIVAHELGHQWGAGHTFSGTTFKCGLHGNKSEPGSGSTIMGYPGFCGGENIRYNELMFHSNSLAAINNRVTSQAYHCGTAIPVAGNNYDPVINAGSDYTIPVSTPFELTAAGSDQDGDQVTYSWDEYDVQYSQSERQETNINTFGTDLGKNVLMRSRMPVSENKRHFPGLTTLLNEELLRSDGTLENNILAQRRKSETLPTTNRSMQFRVRIRDSKGAQAFDDVLITSITRAGPFKVTSHSATSSLNAGASTTVTWDVAGTDSGIINCPNVDISLLMFDDSVQERYEDGLKFLTRSSCERKLATAINNGSATINLPGLSSSKVRIKVACSNNIFFAISENNMSLNGSAPVVDCAAPVPQNNTPDISSLYYLLL